MADRLRALKGLAVGDIFHATGDNGASLICLVSAVTGAVIQARTMTHQFCLEFDRKTGIGKWGEGQASIDSVAPLPAETREALIGLDRRFSQPNTDTKLLDVEKRALLFVSHFYPENPV